MPWIPVIAWAAALVLAAVVLGFCAYEVLWKAKRLRDDLARLQGVQAEAMTLQAALVAASERLARRPAG